MNIQDIDKNFIVEDSLITPNQDYYKIPCEPFDLYGVTFDKQENRFLRLPKKFSSSIGERIEMLSTNTSGGRIRFSTNANLISLRTTHDGLFNMPQYSAMGEAGFVLLEETFGKLKHIKSFMPNDSLNSKTKATHNGFYIEKELDGNKMRDYILFFPNYNSVKELIIGFNGGAKGFPTAESIKTLNRFYTTVLQ